MIVYTPRSWETFHSKQHTRAASWSYEARGRRQGAGRRIPVACRTMQTPRNEAVTRTASSLPILQLLQPPTDTTGLHSFAEWQEFFQPSRYGCGCIFCWMARATYAAALALWMERGRVHVHTRVEENKKVKSSKTKH